MTATVATPETEPSGSLPSGPPPSAAERASSLAAALRGGGRVAGAARSVALVVAFLVVEQLAYHSALPDLIQGLCIGALYGLVGVGVLLIYRTARVINFAAAAIGGVPAITALILDIQHGISYLLVFPIALFGGPAIGALVDVVIIRRFARAPRLILTVVTLAVAQSLGVIGFFIPIWLGAKANSVGNVPTPWGSLEIKDSRGTPVLTGDQVFALITVVAVAVALALFLRYSRLGIALRASAENADRAALLGIPVRSVQTAAWAIAGLIGAIAIFVSAPLIGVPRDATLGLDTLLYGLAAAVVGRMERIGVTLGAGMAIGILLSASGAKSGDPSQATALMLPLILGALLLQRGVLSRAQDSGVSSYTVLKEYRPIPFELKGFPEVRGARFGLVGAVTLLVVVLPFVLPDDQLPKLVLLPIYGIVAVSMVVLTGWGGQISLGQFGIVGLGAAVSGGMVARHNIDFFAALGLGLLAGVVAAVLIGLPALRVQGLYLAVATLAFGFAVYEYALNRHYGIGRLLIGTSVLANVNRPILLGRIDLTNLRSFYGVCVVVLLVVMLSTLSFRRLRGGRVLIAARDNQRAAPAYAINLVRTRLAAFAVSGAFAGMAGTLLAYSERQVIPGSYNVTYSIIIFLATVIGGLTSVPWAVFGAVALEASTLFLPGVLHGAVKDLFGQSTADVLGSIFPLLLTGPLLILNLAKNPAGLQDPGFQLRDRFLRGVASRRGILVPSLVADRRVDDADREAEGIIRAAEAHVEEVEAVRGIDHGQLPTYDGPADGVDADVTGPIPAVPGGPGPARARRTAPAADRAPTDPGVAR
ncbi:MAG TPA: ABC transporter permease [Acidimicrobiales bacterium]|nr:ABC transporter permease [Acidimicrobiales bacterium]